MIVEKAATSLLQACRATSINSSRFIARIPHYEYHIRFDQYVGRKRPAQDVLDRFKRLNSGMWIHAHAGRNKKRYQKDDIFNKTSYYYETCTQEECEMLDKMMTPFWTRPKHYVDDPYEPYNVRHGITSPRVDYKGRLLRERNKILLDDLTSDKYFFDR